MLVVYEHENGINTSELLLEADPDNCLEIGNSGFRSITVTLPDNIYNTEGVTLLEGYTWSYQVSAAALERAAIRFTCNAEEGVLEETLQRSVNEPAVKYNVGQQITLRFDANSEYQFIRWDFDTRYVAIQNYWKPSAVARVVAKTPDSGSDSETLITAVCAKRPTFAVTTERPRNGNDSVPRDSSIYFTFSENIPRGINGEREPGSPSDAGLKQVDYDSQIKNIRISMNGDPVNSCFLDPVQNNSIIGSSIIFKADPENRMTVPSGQTKTVTICVPSDFYYVYKYKNEDYHVTLGADIYETYKVNHDTLDMTGVTFLTLSDTHGGTIEPSGAHEYAMGDVIPVAYEPAAGYQFDNWSVTINGIPVAEDSDEIKLLPRNSPNATLEILKKVTSQVDITANVSQILSVDSIMLTGSKHGTKEDPAYKDSTITVNFNRPIDPSCKKSDIVIACDSIPCTNSFADITISGTQLIIRNTTRLSVGDEELKNISVKIPKSFFYRNDNNRQITLLSDYMFDYWINYETEKKTDVHYRIIERHIDGTLDTELEILTPATRETAAGSVMASRKASTSPEPLATWTYNIDEKIPLEFAASETNAYMFYGWEVSDSTTASLSASRSAESTLNINNASDDGVTVTAVVYRRPQVNLDETSPNGLANTVPKDTPVIIKFRHAIAEKEENKILVSYTAEDNSDDTAIRKQYFTTIVNDARDTVTLMPKETNYLKIRDGRTDETVTVTIPYSICYKTADKKTSIYASEEDTVISYRINNTTSKPTIVQFSMDSQNAHVKVDGNSFGTATILTLSNKQVADFQYDLHNKTAGKFNGWKVSVEDSSYTVTPSGFAVSGHIVVEKEGKTYFTLSIDSNDAAHATVTVNDQIGAVGDRSILISTREYEMPLIDTVSPNGEQPEVECDTPVIIRFTKPMDEGSLRKYVSSVDPGTIQIVSAANSAIHYENFFEEQPLSADGKTLRLVPDVSIYTKYASMKIPELRVILDKQNIFDEDGNCLEGNTEWTYTISSETLEKTKVSTSIDNEYANRTSIKINDLEPDAGYEWSVGKAFQIECVPDEELAFSKWEVSGNENGYIELDDYDAISTQVKVTAGIAGNAAQVTVKPVVYLKPVISSYSPKKADGEVPCNTDVSINFNKPMNEEKLKLYNDLDGSGTIQIVSNTNTSRHFEEYFELTVDESNKSVKLSEKPDKNLREILAGERTLDLKVMLDKSIVDEEGYILSGTTEWVYRINDSTKSQTKVTFSIPQAYANDVRINLTGKSSNDLYSVGQRLELECEQLTGKYALEGWKINNGSTSDYISVTPGVGNGKYYLNINKAKGSTTSTDDAEVITPVCYLIPKVTVKPQFISAGAEFNRAVEIKFNTALNADTFTVYSDSDTNGSVRIYDPYVPSNHFEEYFSVEYNDGTEPTLTITPRTDSTRNVYDLLGDSETKDIKIELIMSSIKDTAGHALSGTTVWDYKINRKSVSTTNVSFSITGNNCEVYYINEQGNEQKAVHGTAVQLNLYQTVKIKCVPSAGYGLSVWTSNNSANVSVDGNTKNSAETTITVKRTGVNAVITPTTYLIPVVETTPVELNEGQPYNKAIEIILNQEVKAVAPYSFELYDGSNNGLIRIEDTEYNRCENYFTSSKTTENGKTKITLSPTAEIFNLLGSAQTKAFNISLIPSSKIVEANNHALTGETTWRYKINRTTVNKTTLNLTQGSTSEDVKKYTLTVNNENYPKTAAPEGYYDYSINNELEIECTPSVPGYAFKEWIIENYGGSDAGTALTDSEIIIQNKYSSRTKVTIKKALAAEVTITPKLYLIPKATTESIFNKDGEQFNKEITINFNTDLDTSTLTLYDSSTKTGNIQIVSAQNEEDHYEDKFSSTVSFSYNSTSKVGTLTLTPNDSLYKIIGSDGFKELIIIFNKDGIKDSAGNYLGGKNNFNYKINTKSTKKTTVYFALTTSTTTGFDVTVDDGSALAVSNATGYELYSTYKIKCTPKDPANYAFDSWQIISGGTSYITIADKNAAETTLYVSGYINSSITVTPKVYLIPKITTTAESLLNTAGQPFNKPIEITFSKLMDTSKLTLSNIKVYNGPENIATDTYFYNPSTSTVSGATKVTLKPKNALFNILGTDKTRDLVIQFDETKITDNETNKHKLEGTTSFDYRINRNSNTKTNIAFSYSNDSTSGYDVFINNGTSTSASTGASTGYDLYQEIEIECKPKSKEFAFKSWSVIPETASCVTITDPNSVKTKVKVNAVSSPTPYSLTIKPILYEIPKVTVPPVYNENGCPFDDPITIDFNVEMMQWNYDDCVVEFYDATNNPHGAVQIVDKAGNDISKYFECEFDELSTKLIITPRDNPILNSANTSFYSEKSVLQWIKGWENVTAVSEMKSLIEAERTRYAVQKREFTIRLIPENLNVLDEIYNAEDFDKLIHLSGTSEWNYCISTQSHYQTNITVQINDADRGNCFVRVGGVEIDANRTYGYNRREKLELRFISTNEEWIFHHWKITKNYGNYIEKYTSTNPNLFNPSKEDTTLLIKTPKNTTDASITVVPVLQQRPVVLENFTKPDYVVSGVNLDNAIDIVFNKPIRNYDLASKIAIKSYKTDGTEENLKNYYTVSPLSNDGLKLTIHPKPGDDLETTLFPPNSQYDKRNVSVIITGIQEREVTGTDAGDDNSSKSDYDSKWEPYNTAPSILTLNSWCTYKYNTNSFTKKIVYNKSRTTDAPALGTVVAYHDSDKNSSDMILPAASNKIDNIPSLSGMTFDEINQKYHAKQVYFVCNAYDYGSGVNSFVVTETVRKTRDGMACEIVYPSQEIGTDTIEEIEPYKYVVEFPYNFVAEEDGWVRLDVRARNHVGAVSPQCVTFYFIKDTSMDAEEYYLTNEYKISGSTVSRSDKNNILNKPTNAANEIAGTKKFSLSSYNNVGLLFVYSSQECSAQSELGLFCKS